MAFADSRIFISVVAVGALAGACAEQLLFIRLIPSAADLPWALWLKYALADIRFEGAIAGALLVNLGWMIRNPRMRMRRSVVAAIAANAAAWIAFLIAVPPLTPSDFALIDAERTRRDAESSGRLMHHEPIIVAARPHTLYYPDSRTDLPLEIFAGPAILWTANLTVPISYGPARATRRESFIVAGGGFILCTAFWAALASAVSGVVRFCRRYLRERSMRTVEERSHRADRWEPSFDSSVLWLAWTDRAVNLRHSSPTGHAVMYGIRSGSNERAVRSSAPREAHL